MVDILLKSDIINPVMRDEILIERILTKLGEKCEKLFDKMLKIITL
jgi:hypothetical protein